MPHKLTVGLPNYHEAGALRRFWTPASTSSAVPRNDNEARAWFVAYCAPKCEAKIAKIVADMGFEAYLPRERSWQRQSRKAVHQNKPRVMLIRPWLVRYLFVELPLSRVGDVVALDDVQALVGTSQGPTRIAGQEVEAIQAREAAGEFDDTVVRQVGEKRPRPRGSKSRNRTVLVPKWADVGVEVRIVDGPFNGFPATIREILPNDTVRVELQMFGRASPAYMELSQLEPIRAAAA